MTIKRWALPLLILLALFFETSLTYKINPEYFKNAEMIDPTTKLRNPIEPSEIIKINIFKINEDFDKEAFDNGVLMLKVN